MWANSAPRWLGCSSRLLLDALGNEPSLRRAADHSPVPIVLVDDDRGFREANAAARLALRLPLQDLRCLQIDDVTAASHMPVLFADWARLTDAGFAAGRHEVSLPDGGCFGVTYHALAGAVPGGHLVAFAPAEWPEDELSPGWDSNAGELKAPLTPRERELLGLAANGCTGPMIAKQLWVSPATVRTHFEHIYEKLDARDRAAAVAKAMRLGLID
jgi:DNA-binding CsgD family transcriptional regulator